MSDISPCGDHMQPECGDCRECRQARVTEAEHDAVVVERDALRATLRKIAEFTAPDRPTYGVSPAWRVLAIHNTAQEALDG